MSEYSYERDGKSDENGANVSSLLFESVDVTVDNQPPVERKRLQSEMSNYSTLSITSTKKPRWSVSLAYLCQTKSWEEARIRALNHPGEASFGWSASTTLLQLDDDISGKSNNNSALSWSQALAMASSPLALCCRYGAPPETVKAILDANKIMVRRCIPNRGTPLHEAIMTCGYSASMQHETQYVEVMRILLRADEELEGEQLNKKRAALMQDVDGNVPLHLLVRQAFYSYVGNISKSISDNKEIISAQSQPSENNDEKQSDQHPFMTILKDLVLSCPEAVAVPDFGSYEETPLVQALKSSVYVNEQVDGLVDGNDRHIRLRNATETSSVNNDPDEGNESSDVHLERRIFNICKVMLLSHPAAASQVVAQSGYTALHSAVFHGRCCDTVRLVSNADMENRRKRQCLGEKGKPRCSNQILEHRVAAAMKANSYGELPLHFAAMRGESTRSLRAIVQTAPEAILHRDTNSLTPLHWLVIRWVDTTIERFGMPTLIDDTDDAVYNNEDNNVSRSLSTTSHSQLSYYDNNTRRLYRNPKTSCMHKRSSRSKCHIDVKFDFEYHVRTNAIDPPVDYRRMRHVFPEHREIEYLLVDRAIYVLRRVRHRHRKMMHNKNQHSKLSENSFLPSTSYRDSIIRCPFVFDSYPVSSEMMELDREAIREEQAICLFWAKVTSLLHAAAIATKTAHYEAILSNQENVVVDEDKMFMLHTACSVPCSSQAIVRLCMGLYPEQMEKRDCVGKLAIHHVACRAINIDEVPLDHKSSDDSDDTYMRGELTSETKTTTSKLIENETHKIVQMIIDGSVPLATRACDHEYRLPLHYAIDTVMRSIATYKKNTLNSHRIMAYLSSMIMYLESFIQRFPESLSRRDGRTGLYPFMLAAMCRFADKQSTVNGSIMDERGSVSGSSARWNNSSGNEFSLSIVFYLLKDNPHLVAQHRVG